MAFACGAAAVVLFACGGFWAIGLDGYVITSAIDPIGPSNPLGKQVARQAGQLLANYGALPARDGGARGRLRRAGRRRPLLARRRAPRGVGVRRQRVRHRRRHRHRGGQPLPVPAAVLARSVASLTVWDASSSQPDAGHHDRRHGRACCRSC